MSWPVHAAQPGMTDMADNAGGKAVAAPRGPSLSRGARAAVRLLVAAGAALACAAIPVAATAAQVVRVEIFGDSLSDAGADLTQPGNLFSATQREPTVAAIPGFPYFLGRFSNGPIWVDQLALANPRVTYSSNAVGGAFAAPINGVDNVWDLNLSDEFAGVDGLAKQVADYSGPSTGATAHVVWAGSNDLLSAPRGGMSATDMVDASVAAIVEAVKALAGKGASNLVVANLPDLGRAPSAMLTDRVDELTQATEAFNKQLFEDLAVLGLDVRTVDIFGEFAKVLDAKEDFDLSNVVSPCLDLTRGTVCTSPNSYLFWDDVHPTERGHTLLADAFAGAIQPVPLPPAMVLLLSGLVLAGLRARRRT